MIVIRSNEEIDCIRRAGRINGYIHEMVRKHLVPGISTRAVDDWVGECLAKNGARPSFRILLSFPGNACISVNDAIGHGVPGDLVMQSGDVVKVDIGVEYQGFHSDAATTHIVGDGTSEAQRLVETTKQSLCAGISAAQSGARISDISFALERVVRQGQYQIVKHAFGHGIGTHLHEDPQIAAFGPAGMGPRLRPGMVIAIEPVVVEGRPDTFVESDGWTTRTRDGKLAAHFEHTVLIREDGPEILTLAEGAVPRWSDIMGPCSLPGYAESVLVREKVIGDEEAILHLAESQMNPILVEAWGRPVWPDEVLRPENARIFVICDRSNQLLGFFTLAYQSTSLHLVTLVLHPQMQGCGAGKMMMQRIEQCAMQANIQKMTLWVQSNNRKARRFYTSLGYIEDGTPYFNTISMYKRLYSVTCGP